VADDELGDEEGYRWIASVVNRAIPGPESVGVQRIAKSLRRVMPAKVDERKVIVEKHLQRRVYVADYYGQRAHIDLQCKLQFGDVRMYIYGHADGDARYMLRLTLLFVKTARALLYQGYMPALAVDGMVADELTTVDGVSLPPPHRASAPPLLRRGSWLSCCSVRRASRCSSRCRTAGRAACSTLKAARFAG